MPDDQDLEEMDPVMRMYMFYHWLEDNNEKIELFKQHGYLIGSFTNPEAVKHLVEGNTYETSDEEFDKTSEMVSEVIRQKDLQAQEVASPRKRKRKKVV